MPQADAYKFVTEVNRLADQVGADHARDVLRVLLTDTDTPLDVSAATVPVALESTTATGATAVPIGPDNTETLILTAPGAERLVGRIHRLKESYAVRVKWKKVDGTTLFEDTLTSGTTGQFDVDVPVIAPRAEVVIEDASGKSKEATYSLVMR